MGRKWSNGPSNWVDDVSQGARCVDRIPQCETARSASILIRLKNRFPAHPIQPHASHDNMIICINHSIIFNQWINTKSMLPQIWQTICKWRINFSCSLSESFSSRWVNNGEQMVSVLAVDLSGPFSTTFGTASGSCGWPRSYHALSHAEPPSPAIPWCKAALPHPQHPSVPKNRLNWKLSRAYLDVWVPKWPLCLQGLCGRAALPQWTCLETPGDQQDWSLSLCLS